jgi:hypothetical protein
VANLKFSQLDRLISDLTKLVNRVSTVATTPKRMAPWLATIGYSTSLWMSMGWMTITLSQSVAELSTPDTCEVDLDLLKSKDLEADPDIVTADKASAKGTTMPSLWWTNEQLPEKLVTNWVADRSQKQVYLLVDTQYWNVLDYIDRYQTIDRIGRVVQGDGYNLKVCNSQKITLARYTCNNNNMGIDPAAPAQQFPRSCQVWLSPVGSIGQNGQGVRNK